eukprot:PITA_26985
MLTPQASLSSEGPYNPRRSCRISDRTMRTVTVKSFDEHQQLNDENWAGSVDDRKSTSGRAFYMGSRLVSWFKKKQSSIAISTTEVEYMVAASCCTQLLWMMQTLQDIHITCTPPISILCDHTSEINISKNPVMYSKTKHIPIKYHFLCEHVLEQKVKLEYVPSKEQVADIFTKPLPSERFEYLRQKMGVVDASSYY